MGCSLQEDRPHLEAQRACGVGPGLILDAAKDVHTSFSPSQGEELYNACSSNCIAAELAFSIAIHPLSGVVTPDFLKIRFKGELTVANLYQAVLGVDLPA